MNETCVETYTGKVFDLVWPQDQVYDIRDIAHSLSQICRYNGHTKRFYSVAEHCVLGTKLVAKKYRKAFLLHDALEAYYGDVTRPLKVLMDSYRTIEAAAGEAVERAFFGRSLKAVERDAVKRADDQMLLAEAYVLLTSKGKDWGPWCPGVRRPRTMELACWNPGQAEDMYLRTWEELKDA